MHITRLLTPTGIDRQLKQEGSQVFLNKPFIFSKLSNNSYVFTLHSAINSVEYSRQKPLSSGILPKWKSHLSENSALWSGKLRF